MSSVHSVSQAPEGTKLWILHVGNLEADEAFLIRGAGTSTLSDPNPPHKRRKLVIVCALIEHPTEGLLLFETGAGKDYPEQWGFPLNDIFARVDYQEDQELDKAIEKCGKNIKDIKGVIMGHLHLDHAGGLNHFKGTDVPIYVHEDEIKHAYYSVATKTDLGVYLPKDLDLNLNWKPMHGNSWELAKGVVMHKAPGHTPGLCILQLNLKDSGTWLFTTDMYHVKENYEGGIPQGWLARDHDDWVRSHQMIRQMQKNTEAKVILGHCKETLMQYELAPKSYQ